jgi:hypothetical protein
VALAVLSGIGIIGAVMAASNLSLAALLLRSPSFLGSALGGGACRMTSKVVIAWRDRACGTARGSSGPAARRSAFGP